MTESGPFTGDGAGQLSPRDADNQRRVRQRRMLSRIVRETEAPTDSFPLIKPDRKAPDDFYDARTGAVLDLAGRIGTVLMASGTPAVATSHQVHAVVAAYGIEHCEVDVINTAIHIAVYRGPTLPPASTMHIIPSRSMDFSRLAAVGRLIHRITEKEIDPTQAHDELDTIITAPHPYKRWVATLAWGGLAFATAGSLGGDLVVCLVSALCTMAIDRVNRRLNRQGLPSFFQYAIGGVIATAPPMLVFKLCLMYGVPFEPTIAIAAGLVVILAGLTLVSSVGDLISGAPVTAVARFFELLMLTAATIAGVALVLHLASRFGAPAISIGASAPPALAQIAVRVMFGAASAATFALACYAERKAAFAAAFGGATAVSGFLLAQSLGLGAVTASFVAAVPAGLVGRLMERRQLAPPLLVSISGITPLLPGLALLHGIYAILNEQSYVGFSAVLGALAISTALAAGVSLGEWSSFKVRRRRFPGRRGRRSPTPNVS